MINSKLNGGENEGIRRALTDEKEVEMEGSELVKRSTGIAV